MMFDEVYFWTDTVKDRKRLLKPDKYKNSILNAWKDLHEKGLVLIYGFVIMPNHLHVIWEMKQLNGKEMPHASFNKQTSHFIVKDLKQNHPAVLPHFKVDDREREYRVWQRDPLAILMDSRIKLEQKLRYLHNNPLHERWNLADRPENYFWSSANFYETGIDDFGFLTHYMEKFG
jgi:putative transposase